MVDLASHILDAKAGHFDPSEFKDQFEVELKKLVRRKAAGKPIDYDKPPGPASNVVDLMEALRRSVEGAGGTRSAPFNGKGSRSKSRKVVSNKRTRQRAA